MLFFIVLLNVVILSVVMLNVVMLCVIIMLSGIILLSAVMPNVCTAFQTEETRRPVGRRTRRCRPFDEDEALLGTILIKLFSAVIYSLAIKINI
jgi:hypothetical protein